MLQVIKVPRGEDPRVEVPRWGGEGRGSDESGEEGSLHLLCLSMLPSFSGLTWLAQVCAAEQAVDF